MKSKSTVGLYILLFVVVVFSMGYYIAGTLALWQEFFYAGRYADAPFDLGDDGQTLRNLHQEATASGLADGDFLLAFNGAPFTGQAQLRSGRTDMLGLIALGPKKSELPYTSTDLRMLQSVAVQTGLTLEVTELVRTT